MPSPLPPCPALGQFHLVNAELSYQLYWSSGDLGLGVGVPFGITSYALVPDGMAPIAGLRPCDFLHTLGHAHPYLNHVRLLKMQLQ